MEPLASNSCIEYPFFSEQECLDGIEYALDKKGNFDNSNVELVQNSIYTSDQVTTANHFKYNFFADNPNYIERLIKALKECLPWLVYPIAVQSWVNIYKTGEGIKWHSHGGLSFHSYSANIFLGGETKPGISYVEPGTNVATIENKLGVMLLANCHLWHMVQPNESKKIRYSVGITVHDYEAITPSVLEGVSLNSPNEGIILLNG